MTAAVVVAVLATAGVAGLALVVILGRQRRAIAEEVASLRELEAVSHGLRRRLEGALAAVPEGILVADENGQVVFRNEAAEEFEGARHGEALVEAAIDELVQRAVVGRPGERTLELFGPPKRSVVIAATPLSDGRQLLGAMAVVEDVTERRRLEEVRRDFVANLSHELKTPVGALSLLAESMLVEDDLGVARRLADRMLAEASRVDRTIEDLLVLSRIEGEGSSRRELVAVGDLLDEAADRVRPAAESRGITLERSTPPADAVAVGDRGQLVSAVSNLVDNAVKYSDEDSVVRLHAERDGQWVALVVSDDGIGIPARDLERVFERFYRVDAARSRQTGGTGLGLAIVRNVAANHGGEVTVDSRLGEGSIFRLRLPLVAGDVLEADGREEGATLP